MKMRRVFVYIDVFVYSLKIRGIMLLNMNGVLRSIFIFVCNVDIFGINGF